MSPIRIAFMGTPEFARYHLASLLDDPQFLVVGVVTQPDRPSGRKMTLTPSPVKKLAIEHSIPVISPEKFNQDSTYLEIKKWQPQAVIVVAYGQIVSQKFLDCFPNRVVNVHGSLLPRWRGAAPIQRAIEAGDSSTGVSLQVMVKKMDAGDIIGKYEIDIAPNTTAMELHDQMLPLGAKLLKVDFVEYLNGDRIPQPQVESLVTIAAKIDKSEGRIDWAKTAHEIHNHVRAMTMGPGSVCQYQGRNLKLIRTHVSENSNSASQKFSPGQIVSVKREEIEVACGIGAIRVLEVQPESRPRMQVKEFLLGHSLIEGEILK